jgi:predicted nucleic acid-binding protein
VNSSVLVDTSVWIEHAKTNIIELSELIDADRVVTHERVLEELFMGGSAEYKVLEEVVYELPSYRAGSMTEFINFASSLGREKRGLQANDLHLLIIAMKVPNCKIFTLDRRLRDLSYMFGVLYK